MSCAARQLRSACCESIVALEVVNATSNPRVSQEDMIATLSITACEVACNYRSCQTSNARDRAQEGRLHCISLRLVSCLHQAETREPERPIDAWTAQISADGQMSAIKDRRAPNLWLSEVCNS